jgi:hypothetical protein
MMMQTLVSIAATALLTVTLEAQVRPTTPTPLRTDTTSGVTAANGTMAGCPGGNGIHISATGGTLTDSSSGVNRVIGIGQSVDTTLVFNISRKTWTRTNLAAAISVGLADEERGRYAVCAGVTALLPSVNLTVQGAHGRVHFVASLKEFNDALRLGPGR